MMDPALITAHRQRALNPDHPVLRGTAQNPDAFFQAREACNGYYAAAPEIVQATMDAFAGVAGRQYHLFDYVGHPKAERVIVMMGSGAEVTHELVEWMLAPRREDRAAQGPPVPPVLGQALPRGAPDDGQGASRSSIGPRSPARSASRSTRTS